MSIISDAIQAKCLAFSDRIIKLNDYLLAQAAMEHEKYKKELRVTPHPVVFSLGSAAYSSLRVLRTMV